LYRWTGARYALRALVFFIAVMGVGGCFVPSALAVGGGAQWEQTPIAMVVHATRVTIELGLETEELATEYDVEYAPAEPPHGEAPAAGSGAWKLVDNALTPPESGTNSIYIGSTDPGEIGGLAPPVHLRGLSPDVLYYARFSAKNATNETDGTEAVVEIPFETPSAEKPEVAKGGSREEGGPIFEEKEVEVRDTSAVFSAKIETNEIIGSTPPTEYEFEYAARQAGNCPGEKSGSWEKFNSKAATSKATGVILGEYERVEAGLENLAPETSYCVRLKAKNSVGETTQTKFTLGEHEEYFTTGTAKPGAGQVVVRNVTADSAHLTAVLTPRGSATTWVLQWAPSATAEGSEWREVAKGVVSREEAEAIPYPDGASFGVSFPGLSPSTAYFVRLVVKNAFGEATSAVERFETSGAPSAETFAVHALQGESWRLLGAVNPNSLPTSLEQTVSLEDGASAGELFTLVYDEEETASIEYNPAGAKESTAEAIRLALEALPSSPKVGVDGPNIGPFTVFFIGSQERVSVSPIKAGSGKVVVSTLHLGGEAYDTHYRFQYQVETSENCGENGWAETGEEDAGSGDTSLVVGADAVGLQSGKSYCYRVVASSNAPGTSLVEGSVQPLVVPTSPVATGTTTGGCRNETARTGLSARLPDCRAYEQVTPIDKEGAQEPFHYRGGIETAVVVGEGGERVALEAPVVDLGSGADSGQSPYFFSREEGKAWSLLAGAPQPETGLYTVHPQVYSADLSMLAFSSEYSTSMLDESPDIDYEVGPAGGPYTSFPVPRKDVLDQSEGWVAANGDFSKLVLQTQDHALLGEPTGTINGADLYEYTVKGGLSQLNVEEQGSTIGSCGATIVHGEEEGGSDHLYSSPHSISTDGSRVFFEAVPATVAASQCSTAVKNLYMRVDGNETVDIGPYRFLGADAQGTTLLLENGAGERVGYDTGSTAVVSESGSETTTNSELELLGIPVRTDPEAGNSFAHPRYTYFQGKVPGLPGGGIVNEGEEKGQEAQQVYRYDDVERVVQCVSCASAFDPEPRRPAALDAEKGLPFLNGGLPYYSAVSADGDYAFFMTVAALVPEDVDGEIPAVNTIYSHSEYFSIAAPGIVSPSTDVYEWRGDGVDGCAVLDGCVALLTDGRGGYLNLFLGSADEGRDVFIYTRSKLLVQDDDTSGDIYDVRVDGGLPEAGGRPVECEGDACSTPPSPPNDQTPSSSTFSGTGNVAPVKPVAKSVKSKKVKKSAKKGKAKKRKKKIVKRKVGRGSRGGKDSGVRGGVGR
jgi:hypothetical protein